jgi:protein tyrosine kinase
LAFRLIRFVRTDGLFEIWEAEDPSSPEGPTYALRRAGAGLTSTPDVARILEASTAVARHVAHENVVLCHGLLEIGGQLTQIEEHAHEVSLEALTEAAARTKAPVDVKLAIWIARQLIEPVVHAESLGFAHHNLAPKHAYVTREGAIKVDFGIAWPAEMPADRTLLDGFTEAAYARPSIAAAEPARRRSEDAYSIAAIVWELIAGVGYASLARTNAGAYVALASIGREAPAPVEAVLSRALALDAPDPYPDTRAFRQAIQRVFYVDLDADDERDGVRAIRDRAGPLFPDRTDGPAPVSEDGITAPDAERPKGTFTRMLEELDAPVRPTELTPADRDSGLAAADGPWAPGRTLANAIATPAPPPIDARAEALSPPEIPTPTVRSPSPSPTALIASGPDRPNVAPVIAPSKSAPAGPRPLAATLIAWALAGFAIALLLLLGANFWGS